MPIDTPAAMAVLFDTVRHANAALDAGAPEAGSLVAAVRVIAGAVGSTPFKLKGGAWTSIHLELKTSAILGTGSRALAAVKPEPQWPTGISRLPAYSPSTSAPTDLGSMVEGTKPAITKLSLWLDFTLSHVFTRPER